ncbi:2-C-methyl-D-erythritol 4-phosphate cytidylyltransferase [Piscinibacter koreensis]|uniref:2-C-methyl-D-erythritol 4-phosphate cytidylyltransferase n=1 Tax=Piscinibacter koreensis TaxID=2742824 RepID=A0A7Y6TY44_9BURK|nr:2-C-methyl-D-erythritol 4-phosphate cytidylyltransferase [Schlegelella koreensis]NUZ07716.1 2-C-methyl-D-erythritol 4-phosphate cytidylyltransferase [Schlegelella koreensis]
MSARLHALVPCAGSGSRAGAPIPKQYVTIAGRPLVAHTLTALEGVERLASILVVVAPDDTRADAALADIDVPRVAIAHCGGAQRAESVANGLSVLRERGAAPDDWVLVHDAARCLVRPAWVDALIDACIDDPVGGLLALPVADTLKAEQGGRVRVTVDRRGMWQAQTPQMFRLGLLAEALARAGSAVTDEASAIEALGHAPGLVPGRIENFKVTQAADFALAERLLTV